MNSRENILRVVELNHSEEVLLDIISTTLPYFTNVTHSFQTIIEAIGGDCTFINNYNDINAILKEDLDKGVSVVNAVKELEGYNLNEYVNKSAKELSFIQKVLMHAELGVAENGAVWVTSKNIINSILPFICEHLILIINESSIIPTMDDAYKKIIIDQNYGVFIAGPSKTADIEQSLVIGAHGPIRTSVLIMKNA
jgi:L-lactate dehydrogenase complex protein LldG